MLKLKPALVIRYANVMCTLFDLCWGWASMDFLWLMRLVSGFLVTWSASGLLVLDIIFLLIRFFHRTSPDSVSYTRRSCSQGSFWCIGIVVGTNFSEHTFHYFSTSIPFSFFAFDLSNLLRIAATWMCFDSMASVSGVCPHRSLQSCGTAHTSKRKRTHLAWPSTAARCRAVRPS